MNKKVAELRISIVQPEGTAGFPSPFHAQILVTTPGENTGLRHETGRIVADDHISPGVRAAVAQHGIVAQTFPTKDERGWSRVVLIQGTTDEDAVVRDDDRELCVVLRRAP